MNRSSMGWQAVLAFAGALGASGVQVERASACGGLFCSGGSNTTTATSFVNQTAERIVFVDHADGTITAVIQIVYEGPADRFAWLLPVPGVPEVAVSSTLVLDALQQQTNPQYQVTTTFQPCVQNFAPSGCACCAGAPSGTAGAGGMASSDPGSLLGGPAVVVEAAGSIGPYDYTVISVQPFALDPAAVAIDWLTANEFDVGQLGPDVLRPYLQDGLNLLAFRLNKDADVGSIRPVMLTYEAEQPSIPLRPTAVAANEDMGVLVWVLAEAQSVPITYRSIVLNEALVDWFNPGLNYADVVSQAADEAGGQAFVTEFASPFAAADALPSTADFDAFTPQPQDRWFDVVFSAGQSWGSWDGFDEALAAAFKLPEGVALADVRRCAEPLALTPDALPQGAEDCAAYAMLPLLAQVQLDVALFRTRLQELVIEPVASTVRALASQPYVTRLYTTLSPDEMTADPVFDVNPDLPGVGNIHAANSLVACGESLGRMTLPQGATIVTNANGGTWPVPMGELPAALQVVQHGSSGPGVVLVDESAQVEGAIFGLASCHFGTSGARSDVLPPSGGGSAASGSVAGGNAADGNAGSSGGRADVTLPDGSGGCRTVGRADPASGLLALLGAAWLARRRRRSRQP